MKTQHCWRARWGDLVAAACTGANTKRIVWIDVFAVRQWPGNGADLDFRGVVRKSLGTLVAVAPVPGTLTEEFIARKPNGVQEFIDSEEYKELEAYLPFCRL